MPDAILAMAQSVLLVAKDLF